VVEWVAALHETLRKLEERRRQGPVPAYRLPNSQEDIAMLSEDLSGLDLSDYVCVCLVCVCVCVCMCVCVCVCVCERE